MMCCVEVLKMAGTKKVGKTGKYGSRYGLRIRKKILKVESKKTKECPYCKRKRAKRIAAGIWECSKCNNKFSGGSYIIKKTKGEK